ncbi:MAG: enolase C-terminal domain-like protein [Verrucomicrobiota bacterium]
MEANCFCDLASIHDSHGMKGGFFDFKRVRRRFRSPLATGAGNVDAVDRVLLRCQSETGVGYGEIAPWPGFPSETIDQAIEVMRSAQGNYSHLCSTVQASRSALPCLAAALSSCEHWTAIAAYGGELPCAGLIALSGDDAAAKIAAGFQTLKIKISATTQEPSIREIFSLFAGQVRLDANGSLNLTAARTWAEFARSEKRVEFLEQPLPVGHPGYASLGQDKIALDESFLTPAGSDWPGLVVIKPLLAGDWTELRAWRQHRLSPVVYSSCFETAIGRQAALWLASLDEEVGTVGFDTLGRFEHDARDRHPAGPIVRGMADFDWDAFWREIS